MSEPEKKLLVAERQMEIMRFVWDRGSATVQEAKKAISDKLSYTAVLSAFQTLEERGLLRHEQEGRAYRFYPVTSREEAAEAWAEHLLDKDPTVARMTAERIWEADHD